MKDTGEVKGCDKFCPEMKWGIDVVMPASRVTAQLMHYTRLARLINLDTFFGYPAGRTAHDGLLGEVRRSAGTFNIHAEFGVKRNQSVCRRQSDDIQFTNVKGWDYIWCTYTKLIVTTFGGASNGDGAKEDYVEQIYQEINFSNLGCRSGDRSVMFGRAQPGKPVKIPEGAYNASMDAAELHPPQGGGTRRAPGGVFGISALLTMLVRNTETVPLEPWSCCCFDPVTNHTTIFGNEWENFKSPIGKVVSTKNFPGHYRRYCVPIDVIPPQGIGLAVIHGCCVIKLKSGGAAHSRPEIRPALRHGFRQADPGDRSSA